ncbi:MAG: guanylate kinase, partial [Clostridia bacterium]|nr:guanylate kinase [Clostridia bacterium]
MLILISGCSGAGKNTVIQAITGKNNNIKFLQSCTTRQHRPNERPDTYQYLTKEEFDHLVKTDQMFEYEEIHQNFYGLTK